MRDAHRMKEKFDLSLDNRQIVSLLIAGIVVIGAVFVLGVVVGKKLADGDRTAGAPDLLSALDQKAATLEKVKADPPLTFQETLTQKAPADEPGKDVRVVTLAKPTPPPAPKEDRTPEPKAEPKPEGDRPDSAVANADEIKAIDLSDAKPEKAEPVKAEVKPAVATSKPKLDRPDGKVVEAAVTARTAPRESAIQAAIARASEKKPTGAYTLQLSASPTRAEADKFVAGLKGKGYAPYIVQAQVPGKGIWYRVRMGSFATKDAAGRYLADFHRETNMEAFVTSTSN